MAREERAAQCADAAIAAFIGNVVERLAAGAQQKRRELPTERRHVTPQVAAGGGGKTARQGPLAHRCLGRQFCKCWGRCQFPLHDVLDGQDGRIAVALELRGPHGHVFV